jgi:hypothetical protein
MPPAVGQLAERLGNLGWVSDLLVAGSLATGDYVPGVSDLDLVALTGGPVGLARQEVLAGLHRELDQEGARGLDLGCVYVDAGRLAESGALHPTWTHGSLVQRSLSGITRAELVRHGFAVLGRPPAAVLPEMTDDDVRRAARAELCGYWAHAARHPLWWRNPVIADLGLTSMARGRHARQTGRLLTKTQAIEQAHAPAWLKDQLRARRQGQPVTSPRTLTALIAWRDARRTVADACRETRDGAQALRGGGVLAPVLIDDLHIALVPIRRLCRRCRDGPGHGVPRRRLAFAAVRLPPQTFPSQSRQRISRAPGCPFG